MNNLRARRNWVGFCLVRAILVLSISQESNGRRFLLIHLSHGWGKGKTEDNTGGTASLLCLSLIPCWLRQNLRNVPARSSTWVSHATARLSVTYRPNFASAALLPIYKPLQSVETNFAVIWVIYIRNAIEREREKVNLVWVIPSRCVATDCWIQKKDLTG